MKRNIRLLLLSILTPLLCGVSFANTVSDLVGGILLVDTDVVLNSSSYTDLYNYSTNGAGTYCINITSSSPYTMSMGFANNGATPTNLYSLYDDQYGNWICLYGNKPFLRAKLNSSSNTVNVKVYKLSSLLNYDITPDCSSVENQLSSCQSDLASCTNSCDTLVSQCQEDKASLQSTYSGCLETNASLNNYNSSLQDQLQACYYSGAVFTGDFTIYEYQLSRSDGFTDLYLPITNSIKLPYGYRGFLDNGVLAIKDLDSFDTAYNIEDSDFQENVIGSYSVVYLFLMSSGLFLIFIYVIRRYFIGLKSAK